LSLYLFGPRWKAALSRELRVDERLIHRWASQDRPVSVKYSNQIARIVRARHDSRVARESGTYAAMVASITSADARALLLVIVAGEIEVRVAAVTQLARNDALPAPAPLEIELSSSSLAAPLRRPLHHPPPRARRMWRPPSS
jgi:hypothetical protein